MPKAKKPLNLAIETAQKEMLNKDNPAALRLRWFDRYAVLQKLLNIQIEETSVGRPPKETPANIPLDLTVPASPETPVEQQPVPQEQPVWQDAVDEFLSDTPAKSPTQIAADREAARKAHLESHPQFDDLQYMRGEHVGKPATKSKDDWQ